ncbi:MAG: hypothetical protein ACLQBY_15430 [Solirubrobacteraceae bacterium]
MSLAELSLRPAKQQLTAHRSGVRHPLASSSRAVRKRRRDVARVLRQPQRELAGGAAIDRRADVLGRQRQADARRDLEVGSVRLLAAEQPLSDPAVDPWMCGITMRSSTSSS